MKITPSKLRKSRWVSVILIVVFSLGMSCVNFNAIVQIPPNITSPIKSTETLVNLSVGTLEDIAEIDILADSRQATSIINMIQRNDERENLLIVDTNGVFQEWSLETLEMVAEYNFLCASINGTNFSADGSLLITPGRVMPEGLNGYTVWDTQTGNSVECWGPHCPDGDPYDARFIDFGIVLKPDGKWVVNYNNDSGISAEILAGNASSIVDIDNPEDNTYLHISKVGFDPSGEYLVYALQDGSVALYSAKEFFGFSKSLSIKNRKYNQLQYNDKGIVTVDLLVDFTRTWLAWLTEDGLTIWDLAKYGSKPQINIKFQGGNTVAFNRSGDVLAVGTKTGFMVFDLGKGKQIAEYSVGEVTALYFTRDNRMLIWGDTHGDIHLWGVK